MTSLDVKTFRLLMDEFDVRVEERNQADEQLAKVNAELETKQKQVASLDQQIDTKESALTRLSDEVRAAEERKDTYLTVSKDLETVQAELKSARSSVAELTATKKTLDKEVKENTECLADITATMTRYFAQMKQEALSISRRKADHIAATEQTEKALKAKQTAIDAERESIKKERHELALLRKQCDIKLASIKYASKNMPEYIKGIQAQLDEAGVKLDFIKMLDKIVK